MSKEDLKKGNKKTQFSKENQPSSEAKSNGHKRKALLKDISQQFISGDSKEALKELAQYLGIDVDNIDLETAMHLKQMERALKNGDTKAYNAIMDRILGKPKQTLDLNTDNVKPIITVRES